MSYDSMALPGNESYLCPGQSMRVQSPDIAPHLIANKLCLFRSAEDGSILQFDGFTGNYEKVFTSASIPSLSGFAFYSSKFDSDVMFATGFHAGSAITKFNGTTGEVPSIYARTSLDAV